MALEVKHRGYTIRFSENADEWSALEVGSGFSSQSLNAVKAKIDAFVLGMRKEAATACYELGLPSSSVAKKTPALVTEYLGTTRLNRHSHEVEHMVAVSAQRDGRERASRVDRSLDSLMPDTLEAHAAFEVYARKADEVARALRDRQAAYDAIPRLTLDDIKPLVELAKGVENG